MPDSPPLLIGGSTTPVTASRNLVGSEGRFDAYCATVHAQPQALLDDLTVLLDSAGWEPRIADAPKARFYQNTAQLVCPKGQQLLYFKWGGSNPHPHVECNGPQAVDLAKYLREGYSHQPTRIDHAIDLSGSKVFEKLLRTARDLCKKYRLRLSFAGDWNNPEAGRTVYIGSRTSQVFVRIYEKGLKYAADMGEAITPELRSWVRVELEFKPDNKTAKALAPTILGPQMWGSTEWTSKLAEKVLAVPSEAVTIRERRESKHDRALRFMGSQYAKHLEWLYNECGGDLSEFGKSVAVLAGIDGIEL